MTGVPGLCGAARCVRCFRLSRGERRQLVIRAYTADEISIDKAAEIPASAGQSLAVGAERRIGNHIPMAR